MTGASRSSESEAVVSERLSSFWESSGDGDGTCVREDGLRSKAFAVPRVAVGLAGLLYPAAALVVDFTP